METKATPEVVKYIIANYLKISQREIARHFGFSKEVCKRVYKIHNLIVPEDVKEKFRTQALTSRTTFTEKDDQFIRENYLTMPVKTLAKHIDRSYCGVMGRLKAMNLIIPEEIIQQRKKDSVFKPGQIPFNKGKKITEFMTPEAIENSKVHRFKKGNIPGNALPDGTEVNRPYKKTGRIYTLIKVPGINKLIPKNIHVWETHHKKKLPPKHNIVFVDGNTQNFQIENLECISHAELMSRNTIHRFPEDLKENIRLISKIKKVIHENSTRTQD